MFSQFLDHTGNGCYVVDYEYSTSHTLVIMVQATLYQELKNSSDKHHSALPMIPNSRFLIGLVYL
jgi:hypothetical protein